jgi:serpin B
MSHKIDQALGRSEKRVGPSREQTRKESERRRKELVERSDLRNDMALALGETQAERGLRIGEGFSFTWSAPSINRLVPRILNPLGSMASGLAPRPATNRLAPGILNRPDPALRPLPKRGPSAKTYLHLSRPLGAPPMDSLTIALLTMTVLLTAVLGFAAGNAAAGVEAERPVSADAKALAQANTAFAFDLYKRLCQPGANLFFSPASLSTAFAMAYDGARGATADEMAQVLHFTLEPDRLNAAFADLLRSWTGDPNRAYELHLANALWGQSGYGFLPAYLKSTREHFGAGLREVDYHADPEAARQVINTWVEQQTKAKIKDLIPSGLLDRQTRLVLTNAVYFKGTWVSPFPKAATRTAPFHVSAGRDVATPMMNKTARFGYMETETFQALELPYKGDHLAMVVLLPKTATGLAALEAALSAQALDGWLGQLKAEEVIVALPKFTMTEQFQLGRALAAMGMARAFSPAADFSGMNGKSHDLYLTEAVHKAFVDVNEEGTEAAAATGIAVGLTAAAPRPKPVFRADHPFVFLIRDRRSGSVLLLGRLVQPPTS